MDISKVNEFSCKVLDTYGYYPVKSVFEAQIREELKQKREVFELFRKHPDWNEDEMCIIIKNDTFRRPFESVALFDFVNFIRGHLPNEDLVKYGNLLNRMSVFSNQFITPEEVDKLEALNNALKKLNAPYSIHSGAKLGKAIQKICHEEKFENIPGYSREYSKLSDQINPKEEPVTSVLSLHPVDFLLMSNGGESWHSCHFIEDGAYMAGTLSYLNDNDSFVYFQVPVNTPVDEIHTVSKIRRQMIFYKDEALGFSRLYPQGNDVGCDDIYKNIRGEVLKITADCLNKDNRWLVSHKGAARGIEACGPAYPDWENDNPGATHCYVAKHESRQKMMPVFIGGNWARCICCGQQIDDTDTLYCYDCR